MTQRLTALLLSSVAFLAAGEVASAQQCQGRPGASAIEQYCEAIPDGTGERVSPSTDEPAGRTSVPTPATNELEGAGQDGQAVLGLASSGGPDGGSGDPPSESAGSDAPPSRDEQASSIASNPPAPVSADGDAAEPSSNNPLRVLSSAVSSGSTVGSGLLWILLALTAGVLIIGWLGFRRRAPNT